MIVVLKVMNVLRLVKSRVWDKVVGMISTKYMST